MSTDNRPVGVFDSGVGGISTLARLARELPGENFVYCGDTANAPYGTKAPETVLRCVHGVVDRLLADDVKAVVIACNTATSVAAAALRAEMTLPIIGIEPALKPAQEARGEGNILVLATPVTLSLPKYRVLEEKYGAGAIPVKCPGLMELVEREDFAEAEAYLAEKLAPFADQTIDAVVLGCTHYVFLRPLLSRLLPERTRVFDGNAGTARQLRRVLEGRGLLANRAHGTVTLTSTGSSPDAVAVMSRLYELGRNLED